MTWSTSVLTTVSSDTEPAIIITFDKAKYLFNAGENASRSFLQSKRNWKKTKGVFFTDVGSHRVGGLPGLLMTFADATIPGLTVYGPPGIVHYMATMRLYTYRDSMYVVPNEISLKPQLSDAPQPCFKDENVTVYALPLLPPIPASQILEETVSASESRKRKHDNIASISERLEAEDLMPEQLTDEMADEYRQLAVRTMFPADLKEPAPKPPKTKRRKKGKGEPDEPSSSQPQSLPVKEVSQKEPPHDASPPIGDHFRRRRAIPPKGFYTQLPKFTSTFPVRDADPSLTPVLSYIVVGPRYRGKFDALKAAELKIPNGELRSALTLGKTITFEVTEDGKTFQRTVRADEIVAPSEPPQVIIILEVPSVAHIPSLVATFKESPFYSKFRRSPDADLNLRCIFHTCGPGVLEDPRYTAFMNSFHDKCHHVIASREHCPDPVTFTSAAFQQLRLRGLDSEIFAVPKYSLELAKDFKAIPGMPERAQLMTSSSTIHLRPPTDVFQETAVQDLDTFHSVATGKEELVLPPHTLKAYNEARDAVKVQEANSMQVVSRGGDIGVLPLGTSSAVPSKYRNVSSTLITIPGYGNLFLDAGEGTWGQLVRMYGRNPSQPNNVWDVLRQTKCIFASHIHGDHHMGIAQILRMRRTLDPPPTAPLYLVAIRPVHLYLRELSDVQNMGLDDPSGNGVIQVMSEALHWKKPEAYAEYGRWRLGGHEPWTEINMSKMNATRLCEALNLDSVRTVDVRHRTICYGLHIKSKDGWSIMFSADTVPADALVYAGQGCTLLIHEATMADDQEDLAVQKAHSTHGQAVAIGKRMNAENILLNHFSARYPKLPSFGDTDETRVIVHAFDHANLTIGNMWKLKHYLPAVIKSMKDTEDEDDQKLDELVANSGYGDVAI
ncbi:hypothetical protein CPB85DRAFT_1323393 [Mucidula mucida]|nr:hypothetical protein CPB85DRAFT_1323393 [Mucidula mucida]